jgi:hypothetical protein
MPQNRLKIVSQLSKSLEHHFEPPKQLFELQNTPPAASRQRNFCINQRRHQRREVHRSTLQTKIETSQSKVTHFCNSIVTGMNRPPTRHVIHVSGLAGHENVNGVPPKRRRRNKKSNSPTQIATVKFMHTRHHHIQRAASKSTSEVMLIALYDLGIHVAVLAHGAFPALLAVADGSSLA